jgi:hypothetical protein
MRAIRDAQLRLEFYKSESGLSKKLEKVSEILDKDISFLEKIAQDFKTKNETKAGGQGNDGGTSSKGSDNKTDVSIGL